MATEQPEQGSATVEDRIFGLYASEAQKAEQPEATPEAAAPEGEQVVDEPGEEDAEAAPAGAELAEVTDDDGTAYQVPAKLKDAFLRNADYTKKTQEIASLRKTAEDKIAFAEAKEQIFGAVLQDVVALRETQSKLTQLQGLDWAALYNADPGQALNLRNQMDTLRVQADQQQQAISGKAQQFEQARQKHAQTQWQLAVEGAKAKIGAVTQAEDAAMLKLVQGLGFSQEELMSRFADPRFLQVVHLASKASALTANKAGALAQVNKAPPVLKPGVGNQMSAEVKQTFAFNKAMKAARTSTEKAKLIEQRLAARLR